MSGLVFRLSLKMSLFIRKLWKWVFLHENYESNDFSDIPLKGDIIVTLWPLFANSLAIGIKPSLILFDLKILNEKYESNNERVQNVI